MGLIALEPFGLSPHTIGREFRELNASCCLVCSYWLVWQKEDILDVQEDTAGVLSITFVLYCWFLSSSSLSLNWYLTAGLQGFSCSGTASAVHGPPEDGAGAKLWGWTEEHCWRASSTSSLQAISTSDQGLQIHLPQHDWVQYRPMHQKIIYWTGKGSV